MQTINEFKLTRNNVRLGEHDTRTTSDGEHQDIEIAYSDFHEEYDVEIDLNDIAIITLAHDVEFNGKFTLFYLQTFPPSGSSEPWG